MMSFLRRRKPQRPEGVRITTPDGDQIPHKLEYAGRQKRQHVWYIIPERVPPFGTELSIERLPGYTDVMFPMGLPTRDSETTPEGHT